MKNSIIKQKSFNFALNIISLYKILVENKEYIISKQLLRSWTSIWANVVEWLNWQSRKDFLAKMYIAYKEANETNYWLELLRESNLVEIDFSKNIQDIQEILKILWSITKTISEENL